MSALIQRVKSAEVCVDGRVTGKIGRGLLVLLGVRKGDGESDLSFLSSKIPELRIFEDASGKFNLSLREIEGEMLIVSQFTLYGDCRKGRRPSFQKQKNPRSKDSLRTIHFQIKRKRHYRSDRGISSKNGSSSHQ